MTLDVFQKLMALFSHYWFFRILTQRTEEKQRFQMACPDTSRKFSIVNSMRVLKAVFAEKMSCNF